MAGPSRPLPRARGCSASESCPAPHLCFPLHLGGINQAGRPRDNRNGGNLLAITADPTPACSSRYLRQAVRLPKSHRAFTCSKQTPGNEPARAGPAHLQRLNMSEWWPVAWGRRERARKGGATLLLHKLKHLLSGTPGHVYPSFTPWSFPKVEKYLNYTEAEKIILGQILQSSLWEV